MKRLEVFLRRAILIIFLTSAVTPTSKAALFYSDEINPLFYYPHLVQSPINMTAGRVQFGTSLSLGLTHFLQASTNIINLFYGVWNFQTKLGIYRSEDFAFALTLDYLNYNLRDFSASNPDVKVTSWLPGAVAGISFHERWAWFVSGKLEYSDYSTDSPGLAASGSANGTTIQSDLSYSYSSHENNKNYVMNVISAGVSYDLTYKIWGVGLSHHWPGFQLGLHYYIDVEDRPLLPIVVGGASFNL